VLLDGPVDTGVDDNVGTALVGTLREALSNAARHAKATSVEVSVVVSHDVLLRVTDNGIGPPDELAPRGNGLRNMTMRAQDLGGSLTVGMGEGGGTVLEWRVPRTA
jgi:signal transduction histidine kinase